MKSLLVALGTLAVWTATVVDASAAWNNVYQPTLFGRCRQRTTTNYYYAPPAVVHSSPVVVAAASPVAACAPCQQQQCSTSYTQRCFYQPVTTYTTQSYYEAVTTTQTSYYYEPVTSYRTSLYYDSCSCSYQQVATPVTSYELRAKSCPVQSWVQRCAQVPVTSYQKSCYWQPQTTCCQTTQGALIPMGASSIAPAQFNGAAPPINGGPPSIYPSSPNQSGPPPQIKDVPGPSGPNVGNTSFSAPPSNWQAAPSYVPQSNQQPHPQVKLERIVFGPESFVEGQIVRTDNAPRANASVLFVSADNGKRQTATANGAGRFQVNLASGNWLVYMQNTDGTAQYHSRLAVQENQTAQIKLVN